jgi:hypothetical protein
VAVPVTHHGRGNLVVGKRGLFAECDDSEHDARVAHIIENPISIGEAIYAPFKRVGKLLTGKIEALTADAEKALDTTVTTGAAAPAAPQPQTKGGSTGSLLMGGGVAIAALGSSFAYIAKGFGGEGWWKLPVAVGIAIVASTPACDSAAGRPGSSPSAPPTPVTPAASADGGSGSSSGSSSYTSCSWSAPGRAASSIGADRRKARRRRRGMP